MKLPYLTANTGKTKKQIIAFGGVNYAQNAGEGELLESAGLSSAQFPCMSQRAGRKVVAGYKDPTGLYARGKLCVVDGTDLRYGGEVVGQVSAGEKTFAAINTKIVIFPDKVYLDTETGELKPLEVDCPVYGGDLSFTTGTLTLAEKTWIDRAGEAGELRFPSGESLTVYTSARVNRSTGAIVTQGGTATDIAEVKAGDVLLVEGEAGAYRVVEGVSASIETGTVEYTLHYIGHAAALHTYPKLNEVFKEGDGVEISGCAGALEGNNKTAIVRAVAERTLTFYENTLTAGTVTGEALLARTVPDFVCLCECDNRLWGAEGSTIWASALGDPTNFKVYDGLSTDSYAVAVGSDGPFTGCCAYGSNVLFWKENCVHKVLGSYPAQYELYTYTVPGIQAGSEKSLAIINETLFYKGRGGVYAYTGGIPELISECFGSRRFGEAVAGSDGERYYISMRNEGGDWELYVFDTQRAIWLREDNTHALDFAQLDGILYFLDASTGKVMMTGQDYSEEGHVAWSATLCRFDETIHGRKGYSRLYLRADLDAGSWLKVEISPDGAPFRQVYTTHDERAKTVQIPILPVRCDNFRVRLSGKGVCIIRSIVREFSVGSEV